MAKDNSPPKNRQDKYWYIAYVWLVLCAVYLFVKTIPVLIWGRK